MRDNLAQTEQSDQNLERQMGRGYIKDSTIKGFPAPLYSADFHFLVGSGDPARLMDLGKEDTAQLLAAYNSLLSGTEGHGPLPPTYR